MSPIGLVVADVDGTLLTPEKAVSQRSLAAIRRLREAGIAFTLASSRPPRGLGMLVEELGLVSPLAAYNGGMLVGPDLGLIEATPIPGDVALSVIEALGRLKLDIWLYRGSEWLVRDPEAPHVGREQGTVRFSPSVVRTFDGLHEGIVKIVGVCDDSGYAVAAQAELRERFTGRVVVGCSQPYYLDVTQAAANKGSALKRLSTLLGVPTGRIAAIGDTMTDVPMFAACGLGIAMGNADLAVRDAAKKVCASNAQEGFADAMERFVLGGV